MLDQGRTVFPSHAPASESSSGGREAAAGEGAGHPPPGPRAGRGIWGRKGRWLRGTGACMGARICRCARASVHVRVCPMPSVCDYRRFRAVRARACRACACACVRFKARAMNGFLPASLRPASRHGPLVSVPQASAGRAGGWAASCRPASRLADGSFGRPAGKPACGQASGQAGRVNGNRRVGEPAGRRAGVLAGWRAGVMTALRVRDCSQCQPR